MSALAVIYLMCIFAAAPVSAAEPFELHLLDVGQGQSVLVEADGHYMLLDAGGRDSSSFVVSYLQQMGIESIDYVAVSHYDEDHMSGAVGALHVFPVSRILLPSYAGEGELYNSFSTAAISNGADILHPKAGETFQFGDALVQVIGPVRSDYELENDRSLAFRIVYGEISCLICGDSEQQSETDMVDAGTDLSSDIYVVNHHGSNSSSSDYFLDAAAPSYALISCGRDNSYGHPAAEMLQRLQARGISMYRTDKQGTIILTSDGQNYSFSQEPCQDWTPGNALESDVSGLSPEDIAARGLELPAIGAEAGDGTGTDTATGGDSTGTDTSAGGDGTGTDTSAGGNGTDTGEAAGTGDTQGDYTYVCNENTRKFHYPDCNSVYQMKEENRVYTNLSREELIAQGYDPCGNCQP